MDEAGSNPSEEAIVSISSQTSTTSDTDETFDIFKKKKKKRPLWQGILWMFYMFFLIFITLMSILRLFSIFMHMRWRSELYGEFPTECGDWAVDNGCTRVQLEELGCVRAKDIVTENSVIFELTDENELNSAIADCIENKDSWKIMSPDNLDSL